jgi:hypothetical protein
VPVQQAATENAIERVGLVVDSSGDLGREDGNIRALAWCDEIAKRKLVPPQAALLKYFRANV